MDPQTEPAAAAAGSLQVQHLRASQFAGPLPPPEVLAGYNDAVPHGAERIIAMAERQERHRQELERIVVLGDARRADRGLYAGTAIVTLAIVCGFVLALAGHDWAGASFVGIGLASLAGVFVYGTRSRREEREQKTRLMIGEHKQR